MTCAPSQVHPQSDLCVGRGVSPVSPSDSSSFGSHSPSAKGRDSMDAWATGGAHTADLIILEDGTSFNAVLEDLIKRNSKLLCEPVMISGSDSSDKLKLKLPGDCDASDSYICMESFLSKLQVDFTNYSRIICEHLPPVMGSSSHCMHSIGGINYSSSISRSMGLPHRYFSICLRFPFPIQRIPLRRRALSAQCLQRSSPR